MKYIYIYTIDYWGVYVLCGVALTFQYDHVIAKKNQYEKILWETISSYLCEDLQNSEDIWHVHTK